MAKNKGFKGYKSEEQKYTPSKKGTGKPKYQNVVKEARVNTRAEAKQSVKNVAKVTGKKLTKADISRKAEKRPNIAKQIDREYKIEKGVRTAPSSTKTPVKRSVRSRGGGMGGALSPKNK